MPRPSGTMATPCAASTRGHVPRQHVAVDEHAARLRCLTRPNSVRISVLLPAPLWPMTQSTSFGLSSMRDVEQHRLAAVADAQALRLEHGCSAHAARSPK